MPKCGSKIDIQNQILDDARLRTYFFSQLFPLLYHEQNSLSYTNALLCLFVSIFKNMIVSLPGCYCCKTECLNRVCL